jgi:hypothetical protein
MDPKTQMGMLIGNMMMNQCIRYIPNIGQLYYFVVEMLPVTGPTP